ncbi:MAG TPA: hypothetical protein DCE44_12370 [Verrucomicrobiales bacterium]|nr:hypothetical protein [Verrucomicrobiales bacterium]
MNSHICFCLTHTLVLLGAATVLAGPFDPYISAYGSLGGTTAQIVDGQIGHSHLSIETHIGDDNRFAFNQPQGGTSGKLLGGTYSSFVDVPSGTLRASVTAPDNLIFDTYAYGEGVGNSVALFLDYVTVYGDFSHGVVSLTLKAHLEGSLLSGPDISPEYPFARPESYGVSKVYFGVGASGPSDSINYQVSHQFDEAARPIDQDLAMVIRVYPTDATQGTFTLSAALQVQSLDGSTSAFGNTARFDLELPPGYTYTSSLGFLTAVPDAGEYALWLGFGWLALMSCSRRPWRHDLCPTKPQATAA